MEFLTHINWEQVTVGVAAIAALIVMIKLNSKTNEKLIEQFGKTNSLLANQLSESRQDYKSFVTSNNHTTTDLVKESTAAHIRGTEALGVHTEMLKEVLSEFRRR